MTDSLFDRIIQAWYLWLPLLLYLLFKDAWGTDTLYVTTEYLVIYYLCCSIIWALNEQGKYGSPMLVVNNEHICCKHPIKAGEWTIFTDYIDAPEYFMTYPLNTKTIVVPTNSVYKIGQNYFSLTRVNLTGWHQIPYFAQDVIITNGMSTENIYFGLHSETLEKELDKITKEAKKSLELLEQTIKLTNDASSKNRETAKYNLEDIEGLKSSFDRLRPANNTLFGGLVDSFKTTDKETTQK